MTTLVQELHDNKPSDKIQKPNFETKAGREFLAFYLSTKLKQVVSYDKKQEKSFILNTKSDFLSNFLKKIINEPNNSIVIGVFGDDEGVFCEKIKFCSEELRLPLVVSDDFSALLQDSKTVIVRCTDLVTKESRGVFDIKIYIKKRKERLDIESCDCEIVVDSECSKEYLSQVLNYIKVITNDFINDAAPAASFY